MAVFKLVFCLQCIPAISSRTSENLGRLQSMFVFFCDMFWNFIDKFGDLWEFLPLFFSLHVINTYCSYANNHTSFYLIVIFCNFVKSSTFFQVYHISYSRICLFFAVIQDWHETTRVLLSENQNYHSSMSCN